jgi:anti-sigma regulatory factor (Ser/Thr protein kinase)
VLGPGPRSVHQARSEAQAVCVQGGFDAERCAAVALVVSELVGNAVRHARAPVSLDLVLDGEDLLVLGRVP